MIRRVLAAAALFMLVWPAPGATQEQMPAILSMRDRARVIDAWLEARLDRVVPELMRREGIDMWALIAREYNEDPVVETMIPATWLAARRRTVLVFFDRGAEEGVERLAVARYNIGALFEGAWDAEAQPDQWKAVADLIVARDPNKIALNYSSTFALADGISHSEYQNFTAAIPEELRGRVVSGERLAVGWLETRIEEEMVVYPLICRIAHAIIREGLSDGVITPGVTTTDDVVWWYRERIRELKLTTWFHTSVSVQRLESPSPREDYSTRPGAQVIMPGDLIHMDIGITYLRLNTDTQQNAYVLRPGETEAPEGLRNALAVGNRLQDILVSKFKAGRTGNEILAAALAQARAEGIEGSIYTHPLGFHGHAAGPTIGLWDRQDGVPGEGDYPLFADTAHAIELNARVRIPEWGGQEIRMMLEEDALFDGIDVWYIDGRQTELILIPAGK